MAVPAPHNPELDRVSRGALAAVNAMLQDRLSAPGAILRNAVAGAISIGITILREFGIADVTRSLSAQVVSLLRGRQTEAAAFQRELESGRREAVIPYSPGLQPGETRTTVEVELSPFGSFTGGMFRFGIRQIGAVESLAGLQEAIANAAVEDLSSYEIENIEGLIHFPSLRILSIEGGA